MYDVGYCTHSPAYSILSTWTSSKEALVKKSFANSQLKTDLSCFYSTLHWIWGIQIEFEGADKIPFQDSQAFYQALPLQGDFTMRQFYYWCTAAIPSTSPIHIHLNLTTHSIHLVLSLALSDPKKFIFLVMYLTTMKAPPGRMPSCSRTIIIQLEDHKLIRSGLADSTGPRSLSTCSTYQINCRLGLLYFLNWTKTQQIIKSKAGRQNL